MKVQDQILGLMLALISVLAFLDGFQEGGYFSNGLTGALLSIISPGTCWSVAFLRRRRNKVNSVCYTGAIVISVIGLIAYYGYATTGPSDPDTAGHMHIVFFPILYLIVGWIVFLPLLLIDMWRNKRINTGIQPTAHSSG
jgi:hypothetical protein